MIRGDSAEHVGIKFTDKSHLWGVLFCFSKLHAKKSAQGSGSMDFCCYAWLASERRSHSGHWQCFRLDLVSHCCQQPFSRGDNAAKENFGYVLETKDLVVQPVERLLSSVRMLATAIRFVSGRRTLQTQNRYIVTVRLGPFGFMMSVVVAVFIAGLLLACGDVETSPGPLETTLTGDNAGQQKRGHRRTN